MTARRSPGVGPALVLGLSALGASASAEQHEHREHGAHEHGRGTVEVVADGPDLAIALRVPAVNVVGFEHEAETGRERAAVTAAVATFARGAELLLPATAARCELEAKDVAIGDHRLGAHAGHEAHEEKDGHEDHEDRGARAAGSRRDGGHSELHAEYRFHCDDPAELDRLEVRVFEHLVDVEVLDAAFVTEAVQGAAALTPAANVLKLAR